MTTHICNMPKKVPWEKIKKCIAGIQKLSGTFICGGCCRTFETICSLHVHCMTHNVGGSYYFDHVTKTAFPKHDTCCSSTQLDLDRFHVVHDTDRIVQGTARSINKPLPNEVSVVKVRNVTKSKDGSIFFEMDEKDAHLSDKTAQKVVEEMNKLGEEVFGKASELEVCVSVPVESGQLLQVCEATSLVMNKHKQTFSSVVPIKPHNDPIDNQVDGTVSQINDSNKTIELNCNAEIKTDADDGTICKSDDSATVNAIKVDNDTGVANIKLDDKSIEKSDVSLNRNASNSTMSDGLPEKNTEVSSLVRSTRKRTLTPKMKEILLVKSLYTNMDNSSPENKCMRKDGRPREKKKRCSSNSTGTNSKFFEADIYASEALLSLSETKGTSEKKAANKSKAEKNMLKSNKNSEEHDKKTSMNNKIVSGTEDQSDKANENEVDDGNNIDDEDTSEVRNDTQSKLRKTNDEMMYGDQTDEIKQESSETLSKYDNDLDSDTVENGNDDNYVESFMDEDDDDDVDFVPKKPRNTLGEIPMHKRHDLVCQTCGKVGTLAMIRYHKQMHSSKKKFACKECGKTLKTAACLRSHMQIHGEKKWKCDLCSAAFFRKAYLETHKTNHTGVYPYICDLCGMKFKMSYILRRHVNCVHKNIRQFECDICQRGFFRASTRDHHRIRHFDPSLKCSYCPKMFKADLDLRKHELTHTGEKLFFCPVCNHGFSQIWPYYKHMWTIHQIPREEAKRIKINNPEIKNMRKIKPNPDTLDIASTNNTSQSSTFSAIPGGKTNVDAHTSLSSIKTCEQLLYATEMDDSNFETERSETSGAIYSKSSGDITDTVVLDIGESMDVNSTIVIQSEDIQTVDSTGYIVVDDGQGDGNIVVFSEFHESEIEQIVGDCATAGPSFTKDLN